MTSEGPKFPGTATQSAGIQWINPQNISAADDVNAVVSDSAFDASVSSALIRGSNYGFGLPAGVTIDGVEVTVRIDKITGLQDATGAVWLVKDGTQAGSPKSTGFWGATPTVVTMGSPTDLWGVVLTRDDVNDSTFGAELRCTAGSNDTDVALDYISMTVYYSEPVTLGVPQAVDIQGFLLPVRMRLHQRYGYRHR